MYKIAIPDSKWGKLKQMKVWCKETYGNGKVDGVYVWRSRREYNYDIKTGRYNIKQIAYFYFQKEEHATWFAIRWV